MDVLGWLQQLAKDANETAEGFQARPLYLLVSVLLPVTIGLVVGYGLKLIERAFGITLAKGGH